VIFDAQRVIDMQLKDKVYFNSGRLPGQALQFTLVNLDTSSDYLCLVRCSYALGADPGGWMGWLATPLACPT